MRLPEITAKMVDGREIPSVYCPRGVTGVLYWSRMENPNVLLGKRIAETRRQRGWKKADLARKAGISASYVTRIERGAYERPSIDQITAIADALGVHVASLTDPPPDDGDDALLRRLIERRIGRDNAELVSAIIEKVRGRTVADQQTVLAVVETLLRTLPPPER